ncbi:MAG: SDR family oxidoreductase [Bacteroidota bacterium]
MAIETRTPLFRGQDYWALVLGGSKGIGLATARKLRAEGMNVCVVHRDRRQEHAQIEADFAKLAALPGEFIGLNVNAFSESSQEKILTALAPAKGKLRLLVHALSRANLRPLAHGERSSPSFPDDISAELQAAWSQLLTPAENARAGVLQLDDFQHTIHQMGLSLLSWTRLFLDQAYFAPDARIIGLTSEGNQKVWPQYAAVSAAKVVLESLARSMAVSLAPHGLRTNIVQAGITDTQSLRMIPGQEQLRAAAIARNPFGKMTTPEDVANVIALLATDEAAWINGALIAVDGGERLR